MKVQTKALIASAVVLVLALSAVSGITYSWFSDVEKSDITVDTAEVDYDVAFSGIANGVAKLEQNESTFTLTGIAAGATIQIKADITNSSTVKTVYKVVLVPTYEKPTGADETGLTPYDMKNIRVTTAGNTTTDLASQQKESWTVGADGILTTATFNQMIIQDWKEVDAPASDGQSVGSVTAVITTPDTYGGSDPRHPIVAIDADGKGYTAKPDTGTYYDWNAQTVRSGLSFELRVIAVQGDYPYTTMDVTSNVASATIPTNKIVTAASVSTSGGEGETKTVTNVIVDFSNVDKYETTTDEDQQTTTQENLVSQTIKLTVKDIQETQIELDLSLYTVTTGETVTETPVKNPTFDNPVVITMTVPGEIRNPKVVYNSEDGTDGTDGTILSSTVNGSGANATTTVVFSVDHFSNYIIKHDKGIETEQELRNALLKGGYIKLANSLTVTKTLECAVEGTVLDLNGKSITTGEKSLIEVDADLEIRNGTVECTYGQNTGESQGRVINIDHEDKGITGVTLRLRDVDVVGPTSNDYNRGISVWGTTDLTIDIEGGSISANHYPLNIVYENTGLKCNVRNATLTGYSAVQTFSPGTQMEFTNCTLNGENKWYDPDGWDDYATIVVVEGAGDTTIKCTNCTISAEQEGTAVEDLFSLRAGCTVTLDGCGFKHNTESVDISEVEQYTSINYKYVAKADFSTVQDTLTIKTEAYAISVVNTLAELKTALVTGGYIGLKGSISDITEAITISKDTVLNLNGKSLNFTNSSLENAVLISGGDLVVYGDTDGSFMTTLGTNLFSVTEDRTLTIVEGSYNRNPSSYVAEGYAVESEDQSGSTVYKVVPAYVSLTIGETTTYYTTVDEAVAALNADTTNGDAKLRFFQDYTATTPSRLEITKPVNISGESKVTVTNVVWIVKASGTVGFSNLKFVTNHNLQNWEHIITITGTDTTTVSVSDCDFVSGCTHSNTRLSAIWTNECSGGSLTVSGSTFSLADGINQNTKRHALELYNLNSVNLSGNTFTDISRPINIDGISSVVSSDNTFDMPDATGYTYTPLKVYSLNKDMEKFEISGDKIDWNEVSKVSLYKVYINTSVTVTGTFVSDMDVFVEYVANSSQETPSVYFTIEGAATIGGSLTATSDFVKLGENGSIITSVAMNPKPVSGVDGYSVKETQESGTYKYALSASTS